MLSSVQAKAQITFNVDANAPWQGYMNVFEPHPLLGAQYLWGSDWQTVDLPAVISGSTLTLAPNSIDDPSDYWYLPSGGPGSVGQKIMDANFYVQLEPDTVSGQTVTFSGNVLSNTLTGPHVAKAFIRDFTPDFGFFTYTEIELTPGPFSIELATDPGTGRHVQYGFNFNGPNVWITDVAPYGTVEVEVIATSLPGDLNGDGEVTGRDFLFWQRGETVPPHDPALLAEWQGAYNGGGLAGISVVPEPASLSLISAFACGLLLRRTRLGA